MVNCVAFPFQFRQFRIIVVCGGEMHQMYAPRLCARFLFPSVFILCMFVFDQQITALFSVERDSGPRPYLWIPVHGLWYIHQNIMTVDVEFVERIHFEPKVYQP